MFRSGSSANLLMMARALEPRPLAKMARVGMGWSGFLKVPF